MRSPFTNIDKAFAPFYTDFFSVKTKDGKKTTLRTCLFQNMTGEPFSEDAMETDRQDIMLICKEEDWPWVKKNVSRGDLIQSDSSGKKYRVSEVEDDFGVGKMIRAREV